MYTGVYMYICIERDMCIYIYIYIYICMYIYTIYTHRPRGSIYLDGQKACCRHARNMLQSIHVGQRTRKNPQTLNPKP